MLNNPMFKNPMSKLHLITKPGLICFLITLFYFPIGVAHEGGYPQIIPLPNAFHPEGIATGRGHKAYVGSLANGAIYQVDLLSGHGETVIDGEAGRIAVGLAYDKRRNYLYVAGGITGTITVYDMEALSVVAEYQTSPEATGFINDAIITERAAYFTDSFLPVAYRIPLTRSGKIMDSSHMETIPLSGDITYIAGEFNSNGIVASEDGDLYINTSASGQLVRLDPNNGNTTEVMVRGGDLVSGDGMVLHDNTLYVVQNFLNQITVVRLSEDGNEGTITEIISHPDFQIPTTAAKFGEALYVVNARFDVAPPPFLGVPPVDPNTEFNLVRIDIGND